MEVTLGHVYSSFNLLSRIVDQKLPIRMAFRFTRLIRELNKEWTSLEKLRDGLIKQHGEQVEGGADGSFTVPPANREAFFLEFQELLAETVEVEWDLVSIEEPGLSELQLSVKDLSVLGWLFTEFKQLADEAAAEVAAEAIASELADSDAETEDTPDAEATAEPVEEPAEVG